MSAEDPKNKAGTIDSKPAPADTPQPDDNPSAAAGRPQDRPREIGGRGGLDPTRYGDWEKAGRCIDF
jgi:hypothetical protein